MAPGGGARTGHPSCRGPRAGEQSGEVRLAGCKEGVRVIQLRTWLGSGPTNRVNGTYVPVERRVKPGQGGELPAEGSSGLGLSQLHQPEGESTGGSALTTGGGPHR